MKLQTIILSAFILISSQLAFGQHNNNHEFDGRVYADGKKAKDVQVTVFDGDKQKYTYTTTGNGRFIFLSGAERLYTVVLEKEGYHPKRILINTKNTRRIIGSVEEYEFDIELEPIESIEYYEIEYPEEVIEFDHASARFKQKERLSL